ncbi:MAG TPA: ATP-binding protein [Gammaproteobacteria bacterium]
MTPLVRIRLRHDLDAVGMRQTARHVARLLGFEYHDQIRIATAVSELVRAATGDDEAVALAELAVTNDSAPQRLVIRVRGANLECDATAAGAGGTLAAERLLDRLDVEDRESDEVVLARTLPHGAPLVTALRAEEIRKAIQQIDYTATHAYLTELKQQNRELSSTLLELERKQEELTRLNAELADTNRGVMALYSELDEHANHLRQADEIKTKFFSNMSHEFRTPLNSICTLSKLLLDESDGPLNAEQARQVRLIHDAAGEMLELVSDLLDLSKVEAGKVSLQVGQFDVGELFGTLRGMMRPLLHGSPISLEFDEPSHVPRIIGDQAKVGQVLRNFLSNAVKFTEEGSIKVSARRLRDGEPISGQSKPAAQESVLFCVADTGIGIGPDDQEFIFDEFTQVRHSLQRKVRGTGLGLPLCRKLASMMGGRVWVESELGVGSRFYLLVPRFYRPAFDRLPPLRQPVPEKHRGIGAKAPLLILTQSGERSRRIEALFEKSVFEIVPAGIDAITKDYLERLQPRAAITDFGLTGAPAREAVARLQRCAIPLIHLGADGDFVAARHPSTRAWWTSRASKHCEAA